MPDSPEVTDDIESQGTLGVALGHWCKFGKKFSWVDYTTLHWEGNHLNQKYPNETW